MDISVAAILVAMVAPLAAMPADSLRLETDVRATVAAGEPVTVMLRVTNVGPRPLELSLMGRSVTFDVVVSTADGVVVWRRLEREIVPAILQLRTLAPGESVELEHTWDQRTRAGEAVKPGAYRVSGAIITDGRPLTTPVVPLRIVPRSG